MLSKNVTYVPIPRNQRGSLMVLVYPGLIYFCDYHNNKSEYPCMLNLDGLGLHDRRRIAGKLRCWLNMEFDKKHNSDSFNIFTIHSYYDINIS